MCNLNIQKVMITEIVEGPYSINNIDLYSNYLGNIIVGLNWTFLYWLAKQFFGKTQIYLIVKTHAQSQLWICVTVSICILLFYLILQAAYRICQLGDELGSLELYLGFSSQRTSFHCTIIEATLYTTSGQEMCVYVCLSSQKYRYVCLAIPPTVYL